MSRRHRPSRADRKPVTRRYVQRVVERARQDIIRAIVASASVESRSMANAVDVVWQRAPQSMSEADVAQRLERVS